MKYGLSDEVIEKIRNVFQSVPEIQSAILYGSRAKGNFRNGSDIDLTFKGKSLDLSIINLLSLKLDELYLPYTFDLSVFDQISNIELIDHINRIGVVFYERTQ